VLEMGVRQQYFLVKPELDMLLDSASGDLPTINICMNLCCHILAMIGCHIFHDPGDEVVFECALYYLVEKVGCQKLMYVGAWKV
jgi:hypothetical protein